MFKKYQPYLLRGIVHRTPSRPTRQRRPEGLLNIRDNQVRRKRQFAVRKVLECHASSIIADDERSRLESREPHHEHLLGVDFEEDMESKMLVLVMALEKLFNTGRTSITRRGQEGIIQCCPGRLRGERGTVATSRERQQDEEKTRHDSGRPDVARSASNQAQEMPMRVVSPIACSMA